MTTSQLSATGTPPRSSASPAYHVRLAADADDVLAAQRLRHEVFGVEGGAVTPGPTGIDADPFDDLCDHLIVCENARSDSHSPGPDRDVVATYRLLPPHANDFTPRATGLYSHREFDLSPLEGILDRTVEAGRSCVAGRHRGGAPIWLLWSGIARYMQTTGYRYLIGCASVSLADGGGNAAAVAQRVQDRHMAPRRLHCMPRTPLDTDATRPSGTPMIPPLLRGYLRLGALICGAPAVDEAFQTADFLVLLDLENADQRYLRLFSDHSPHQLLGQQ